jgi:hypothetical protein
MLPRKKTAIAKMLISNAVAKKNMLSNGLIILCASLIFKSSGKA